MKNNSYNIDFKLENDPTVLFLSINDSLMAIEESARSMADTLSESLQLIENEMRIMNEESNSLYSSIVQAFSDVTVFITFHNELQRNSAAIRSINEVQKKFEGILNKARDGFNSYITLVRNARTAITATTGATKLLNIVMASSPFLAAAAAVIALGTAIYQMCSGSEEATEKQKGLKEAEEAYASSAAQAKAEIDMEVAALGQLIQNQGDETDKVNELNRKYGESMGYHKTAAEWYDTLIKKSKAYCQAIGYEAQAKKIAAEKAQKEIELEELQRQKAEMERSGKHKEKEWGLGLNSVGYLVLTEKEVNTDAYDEILKKERELQKETAELEGSFNSCIKKMYQGMDELKKSDGLEQTGNDLKKKVPQQKIADGSIAALEARLNKLRQDQKKAPIELALSFADEIAKAEQELAATKQWLETQTFRAKYTMENITPLEGKASLGESLGKATEGSLAGMGNMKLTPPTLELEKPLSAMEQWNMALDSATEKNAVLTTSLGGISSTMNSLGSVVGGAAGAWLEWGGNLLNAIAQALPQLAALATSNTGVAATGAAASVASIPIVGPIMAVAAVASVLAALANLPKFADGALAYGPTLGLFGEYAGASRNPEVVAPLDRLKRMIEPNRGNRFAEEVEFKIEGRKLVGLLKRMENLEKRS